MLSDTDNVMRLSELDSVQDMTELFFFIKKPRNKRIGWQTAPNQSQNDSFNMDTALTEGNGEYSNGNQHLLRPVFTCAWQKEI